MKEYLEISKQNIKSGQIISIFIALVFLISLLVILIIDFSFSILFILFLVIGLYYLILFMNKSRDTYHKNAKVYLSSLFNKEVYEIAVIKGVYTTAFLGYSIKFKDGKGYYFRLLIEAYKLSRCLEVVW